MDRCSRDRCSRSRDRGMAACYNDMCVEGEMVLVAHLVILTFLFCFCLSWWRRKGRKAGQPAVSSC